MAESSKKRNSFRKLFPNLFSHKSKDKKSSKDSNSSSKESSIKYNKCESPKSYKKNFNREKRHDHVLYENLTTIRGSYNNETHSNGQTSTHSSSSTLVAENINARNDCLLGEPKVNYPIYAARPQVPSKPHNEDNRSQKKNNLIENVYPDVYYHSLDKLNDKTLPINDIEVLRVSQQTHPASVGAEIKKVSTKFIISPKKEAEVRTIQPTRARSLSFDNNKDEHIKIRTQTNKISQSSIKPYNYSAPTSPLPINHKIPNMPETISPYEHVRKNIMEVEEKRNSLSRSSLRTKLTPSPKQIMTDRKHPQITLIPNQKTKLEDTVQKENTRKKVEAFYWQKLKELKEKEDEYYLRQTLNSTYRRSPLTTTSNFNSNRSTPNTFGVEPRSNSLPRGKSLYPNSDQVYASPFVRGDVGRKTDTFVITKNSQKDLHDVVYRHPEKLNLIFNSVKNKNESVYQHTSLSHDTSLIQYPKRVSFEEEYAENSIRDFVKINNLQNTSVDKMYQKVYKRSGLQSSTVLKTGESQLKVLSKSPPLPPIRTTSYGSSSKNSKLLNNKAINLARGGYSIYSESESGSEAGEIQRILKNTARREEDWHQDGSRLDGGLSDSEGAGRVPTRGRASRREDPRRHTLAGNHLYVHTHQPGHINSLDVQSNGVGEMNVPEYATVFKYKTEGCHKVNDPIIRKPPLPRGYPPPSNTLLFDDDPGIMSEVETSSTGFRRGGKQRSSLPVVRTPSKTLERPLGLVFLQYRNETKRALLPNEITSIDTVKALFVRSFPKQLTMQYMDSPMVKIYIHDSSKDMFYELEDVRSHLRDIRDRSVLRLFEATDMGGGVFPGAVGVGSLAMPPGAATCSGPSSWDQDQSYFSEPEIDSEYHHQHVHKTKVKAPAYYMGSAAPSTIPRGGSMLRAFSPGAPPVPADRVKSLPGSGHSGDAYMSSPERTVNRTPYEDPYYSQFLGPVSGRSNIAPVIDEESSDSVIIDDAYQMYGVNAITTAPRPMPRPPYDARLNSQADDLQRLRVEKMERQLANLTGLVQKALQVPGPTTSPAAAPRQEFPQYTARSNNQDAVRFASAERPPKLGRDKFQKSVSFEKSVSFSDDPPDMNSPKQHSPQHSADTKPTKPAIKSSTLPRTSSQERDRLKPAPPPKPAGLTGQQPMILPRTFIMSVSTDFANGLRNLQNQSRDLRIETRNLRRSTLSQAIQMRQLIAETIVKIGDLAASFSEHDSDSQLSREEEIYRQTMLLLENDLYELEATVERLRGQAANRETRVNMNDIESIAMVLSKSSKTVADWKLKFPILQDTMKVKLAAEMEKVLRREKLLEEEPERLELALRRCKKLTGTLVTLKRLACVQEQRLPINDGRISPGSSQSSTFTGGPSSEEFASENSFHMAQGHNKGPGGVCVGRGSADTRPENALDALLDELQTFAKPPERSGCGDGSLRRLHSYPSGSDTDASPPVRARGQHPPKPPVPERHPELLVMAARRAPPPPPPRTTSRSPLASPTSASLPSPPNDVVDTRSAPLPQASDQNDDDKSITKQALLEQRHQELLKKQKALQEQYARLQMLQRSGSTLPPTAQPDLKKTGSESNLLTKMNLNLAPSMVSGSMTHLAGNSFDRKNSDGSIHSEEAAGQGGKSSKVIATTNKVYETDIL